LTPARDIHALCLGDRVSIKVARLDKDYEVEYIQLSAKVVNVDYPSFSVKYDEPLPDGCEYQAFSMSQIPDVVTIKTKNRDVQFAGFAELLVKEMLALNGSRYPDFIEKYSQIVARHAYDLVSHTLEMVPLLMVAIPDAQSIDEVISLIPDLTAFPGEQPLERDKEITIIVNGQRKTTIARDASYFQIMYLAFDSVIMPSNIPFTIIYRHGPAEKPEGSLLMNETVLLKDGMIFSVAVTGNA
jgi:hypothetical protein